MAGSLGKSLRITDPPVPGRGGGISRGKSPGLKDGIKPTQVPVGSVLGESKYSYVVSDVRAAYVPSTVCSEELSIRLSTTPFTRMVFVFRYDDDDALLAISDAVSRVNTRSMPDIQGEKWKTVTICYRSLFIINSYYFIILCCENLLVFSTVFLSEIVVNHSDAITFRITEHLNKKQCNRFRHLIQSMDM